jgi:hypothetical protein
MIYYICFNDVQKLPEDYEDDRNMSELWQIVCTKRNFYIGAYVDFIVWKVIPAFN